MQIARAIVEVNEAIAAADNLQDLTDNLFNAVKAFVPCDWLGLFNIYLHDTRINVTTNSRLPFNWDECYSAIAAIDPANRKTLATRPGSCLHFPKIYNPDADCDRYVLEYIKRTSDTGMGMVLPVATAVYDHRLALGFFREKDNDLFNQESEVLASALQPIVAAYCHALLERSTIDLRTALTANDLITPYILLNERWAIVDFPARTLHFLRSIYLNETLIDLPDEIKAWLERVKLDDQRLRSKENCHTEVLAERRLGLKFKPLELEDGRFYGLLQFVDKRSADDFSPLQACGLTLRESALLSFLPAGYSNAQIAAALGIKEVTVKKHLKTIGDKLGAAGKTEILYAAMTRLSELSGAAGPNANPGLKL